MPLYFSRVVTISDQLEREDDVAKRLARLEEQVGDLNDLNLFKFKFLIMLRTRVTCHHKLRQQSTKQRRSIAPVGHPLV